MRGLEDGPDGRKQNAACIRNSGWQVLAVRIEMMFRR